MTEDDKHRFALGEVQRHRRAAVGDPITGGFNDAGVGMPKLGFLARDAEARVDLRDSRHQTADVDVTGIVDRIGAGDAFAAGVLHAHLSGGDARAMAETGLALTCLKHSLPGDASRFGQGDIDAFHGGGLDVRR